MLEIIAAALLTVSLALNAFTFLSLLKLRSLSPPKKSNAPPVSILKPLCGVDPRLETNLRSFFELDYPKFEIIFGVQNPKDPAIEIVRRLAPEYPKIRTLLVIDPSHHAANPKVSNLIGMSGHARHDLTLISDSNVLVEADYLATIIDEYIEQDAAIVTNAFTAESRSSMASRLESLQLNTFNTGGMAAANLKLGQTAVVGKSMLFKRSELEGDLAELGDILAEDQVCALKIVEATGRKAVLSKVVISNVIGKLSLRSFLRRQRRWCVLRRWLNPGLYLFEWLFHTSAIALLLIALIPNLTLLLLGVSAISIRALLDTRSERALGLGSSFWSNLIISPLRDLSMAFAWGSAWFHSQVSWRGKSYRVGKMTRLKQAGSDDSAATQCASAEEWPDAETLAVQIEAELLANRDFTSPLPNKVKA